MRRGPAEHLQPAIFPGRGASAGEEEEEEEEREEEERGFLCEEVGAAGVAETLFSEDPSRSLLVAPADRCCSTE